MTYDKPLWQDDEIQKAWQDHKKSHVTSSANMDRLAFYLRVSTIS